MKFHKRYVDTQGFVEIFDLELGDSFKFYLSTASWHHQVDLLKLLEYLSFYNTYEYLKYLNFMLHN